MFLTFISLKGKMLLTKVNYSNITDEDTHFAIYGFFSV